MTANINHNHKRSHGSRGRTLALTIALLLFLLAPLSGVTAQEETPLVLNLSRDFGYSSGTGKIQGAFSMKISGPEDLVRVVFLIDGNSIGEDSEKPFSLQFHTSAYSLGEHILGAIGYTRDGAELRSNEYRREFVPADEGFQAAGKIAIPILGVALLFMLLSFAVPALLGRKGRSLAPGTPRNYGLLGGAICPKCNRPFPLSLFGSNLLFGRLERCPHCGKWSLVHRSSLDVLRAAEAAEIDDAKNAGLVPGISPEEKLSKELDDSRFNDV